jgi:hypothetical protein
LRDVLERGQQRMRTHEIPAEQTVPGTRIVDKEQQEPAQRQFEEGMEKGVKTATKVKNSPWWKGTGKRNEEAPSLRSRFAGVGGKENTELYWLMRQLGAFA